jgi:hypothetical protein
VPTNVSLFAVRNVVLTQTPAPGGVASSSMIVIVALDGEPRTAPPRGAVKTTVKLSFGSSEMSWTIGTFTVALDWPSANGTIAAVVV